MVDDMAEALRVRGPHGRGLWHDPPAAIAFAHRQFLIDRRVVPEKQPIVSSCKRYVLVCDGEIHNTAELIAELAPTARLAPDSSEARILLEAIAVWGAEAALRRMNGMFA